MSKLVVGSRIDDQTKLGKRDAFHVPGVVVTSSVTIHPGDDVRFVFGSNYEVIPCGRKERHGVADPFVTGDLNAGELFWIFLCPEIVGNLVHHFEIVGVPTNKMHDSTSEILTLQDELAKARARISVLEDELVETTEDDDDGCRGCY